MASAMEGMLYQDASTYHHDISEVAADFRQQARKEGEGGTSPGRMELVSHFESKMVLGEEDANRANAPRGLATSRRMRVPVGPRKLLEARRRKAPKLSRRNYYNIYQDWDKAGDFYRPAPRSLSNPTWAHAEHDDKMADVSPRPSGRFYDRGNNKRKRRQNGKRACVSNPFHFVPFADPHAHSQTMTGRTAATTAAPRAAARKSPSW